MRWKQKDGGFYENSMASAYPYTIDFDARYGISFERKRKEDLRMGSGGGNNEKERGRGGK